MRALKLPWPPKECNPNYRGHWSKKAKAAKTYRAECFWLAKAALLRPQGDCVLSLIFCPPDKRHRDDDNMIAAFKSGRDGIAEAVGINDSRFQLRVDVADPLPGGVVFVELLSI